MSDPHLPKIRQVGPKPPDWPRLLLVAVLTMALAFGLAWVHLFYKSLPHPLSP